MVASCRPTMKNDREKARQSLQDKTATSLLRHHLILTLNSNELRGIFLLDFEDF